MLRISISALAPGERDALHLHRDRLRGVPLSMFIIGIIIIVIIIIIITIIIIIIISVIIIVYHYHHIITSRRAPRVAWPTGTRAAAARSAGALRI